MTNGGNDYSPVFSNDLNTIYFARSEEQGASIWSCSLNNGMLSSYAFGFNPTLLNKPVETIICTRINGNGKGEIWMLDSKDGTEQCILSDLDHSFTSPSISPDGRWIVCTGSSAIPLDEKGKKFYHNTDIYLFKIDGSSLRQVTFHAAEDLSPVWSPTGDYIYFISQRGDSEGRANIWRIKFNEQDFN